MAKKELINKQNLIFELRQKSVDSKSSESFKKGLLKNLERSLDEQESKSFNLSFLFMKKQYMMLGVFAVAVVSLGGAVFLNNYVNSPKMASRQSDGSEAFVAEDSDTSGAAGGTQLAEGDMKMSIAMDNWHTLAEARDVMAFIIREPQILIDGAKLYDIRTIKDWQDAGTKSTGLYLTYNKGDETSYVVNQSQGPSTLMEGETIAVDGVNGYYFMVEGEYDPEQMLISEDTGYPRSSIQWNKGDINYYVAEYGTLTKAQLLEVANSLK